ncbi:cytochrome c3 family protein [Schlesneria paludicola]|uniref:cytochrome c3 family protein n=1 Tax=Schlesneria paludicola TaxID=360056 RepID=UPI00029AF142|nr:cytochrome c3 family protein [Schlesneria paludicola]
MPQIFHRSLNTVSKVTIFGGLIFCALLAFGWDQFNRSSYVTEADVVREQPIPFSHEHHVSGLGIDCRYCHTSVETSSFAGMPATETCMSCHSQVWKDSPMLEPVRASLRTGKPLAWTRVHDVPDFVYFDHSIHVAKGVGCESCHGRVDQMPLMRRAHTLQMGWCLDCHAHPERSIRPLDEIYSFGIKHTSREQEDLSRELRIDSKPLLDCGTCHR